MCRLVAWPMLSLLLLPMAGCKKPESACQKKCRGLLSCYQETRGPVDSASKSLSHCVAICEGKGDRERGKVLESFGTMDCAAWMRRHRPDAEHVLDLVGASPGPGALTQKPAEAGEHPFPRLVTGPEKDSKGKGAAGVTLMDRVDRIVITTPRDSVEILRAEGPKKPGGMPSWKLVKPSEGPADSLAVRNLLSRMERLPVQGRAEIPPKDFASHQLTEKQGVRCQIYAGKELLADMIVGRSDRPGAKGRGGVTTLVRPTGSQQVWRVTGALAYLFNRPSEGWRDASMIHLDRDEIVKLSLVVPGGRLVLRRAPPLPDPQKGAASWEILESEPKLDSLDQNAIQRLISVLTHLRAPSFEKDVTPEKTGLDTPQARVTLTDKDDKSVTLLIGNRDAARRSAYGQMQGDPRVFLLRHPLDELPDDPISSYRDKTLVRAEPNQVVGLVVEKAGEQIEFIRDGNQWKALRPEGLKLNLGRLLGAVRLLEGRFSGHELVKDAAAESTGLGKPEGRIVVKILAEADKPPRVVELLVGKAGPRGDIHLQVKGEKDVMLVRKWILDRIWQGAKEWEGGVNTPSSALPRASARDGEQPASR